MYGWNASALLILLPSFPLMASTGPGCFVFHFPPVIQVGTHLLKFNQSTGFFGHRYPSVRWLTHLHLTYYLQHLAVQDGEKQIQPVDKLYSSSRPYQSSSQNKCADRQTDAFPWPNSFLSVNDLITDSQEVKIATCLKTGLFPLSRHIQSITNRPQIRFHFFFITENSSLFINLYLCNEWMDPKKSLLIWKIQNRSIDQENRPMHMSDLKQKHFCRAVRWGKFSAANSSGFPGYLHGRRNGFEHHPQNPIPDKFHISLGEIKK